MVLKRFHFPPLLLVSFLFLHSTCTVFLFEEEEEKEEVVVVVVVSPVFTAV